MKVVNLKWIGGKNVVNQFVIELPSGTYFQSYDDVIAWKKHDGTVVINPSVWNKILNTKRFLCHFLGITNGELNYKIKSGEYVLENLSI